MLQGWHLTVIVSVPAVALIITVVALWARAASPQPSEQRDEPWQRAERLRILEGLIQVNDDPHRFLDLVLSATDTTAAEEALQEQFGWSRAQARAALNVQFRMMSEETRQAILAEADGLRT